MIVRHVLLILPGVDGVVICGRVTVVLKMLMAIEVDIVSVRFNQRFEVINDRLIIIVVKPKHWMVHIRGFPYNFFVL
jgi:hypothetical protein